MSYDYEHDSVSCDDCGFLVLLTMDWSADQPERFECECTTINPEEDDYPDHWSGHQKPLSAYGGASA